MIVAGITASRQYAGGGAYAPGAADFPGTNDYYRRSSALDGTSDVKTWTFSFWFKPGTAGSTMRPFYVGSNGNQIEVDVASDGEDVSVTCRNSNTFVISITADVATTVSSWNHFICSFDTSDSGKRHLYVNDTEADPGGGTFANVALKHTSSPVTIGASNTALGDYAGCMTEIWHDDSYIDLSVESNRRKWVTSDVKPVNLGANGETPTGSSPLLYMTGDSSTFATNLGTGGGSFTETGTVGDCADGPGD